MELEHNPAYRVTANGADITATVRERLKSLRLVDETGVTSDTLDIALADNDPTRPIALPPVGAELSVSLGYGSKLRDMGVFVVDELELQISPGSVTIRARSAPQTKSKGGLLHLQAQKTRSWRAGTTIGAMVRKIAAEHGLASAVSGALAGIALPHTDQSSESDINLLQRLAKRYDAVAKPVGRALLFTARGAAESTSGAAMPRTIITREKGGAGYVLIASRDSPGTVVAYYRVMDEARRHEIAVGEGDPVRRLRMSYRDQASAIAAARAELRKRARATRSLSYSMPGRPGIIAESIAAMTGFRDGIAGDWLVTRAEHFIGPGGYSTTIEAELPNADAAVSAASGATQTDTEQTATQAGLTGP